MTVDNHEFRQRGETSPGIPYLSWQLNHRRHDQDVPVTSREIVAQHIVPLVEQGCASSWESPMHEGGVSSYEGSDAAFETYP